MNKLIDIAYSIDLFRQLHWHLQEGKNFLSLIKQHAHDSFSDDNFLLFILKITV